VSLARPRTGDVHGASVSEAFMLAAIAPTPVLAAAFTTVDVWLAVVVALLLIMLAFLALAETALNRISVMKAQTLAADGKRGGKVLVQLVREPERFLNPVILAVNMAATVQAVLTGVVADRVFGPIGVLIGTVLNVVVFFIFTEALPKTWAVLNPEQAALIAARPVSWLVRFWPLRIVSRAFIVITNVIIPGKGLKQGPFVSEAELLHIVSAAANDEIIEHEERELIESVIEFGDTLVREVMVPRTDMIAIGHDKSITDAMEAGIEHGFSRLPVVGEDSDDVRGIVYLKDLMRAERGGQGEMAVRSVQRPAVFVPETKKVDALLKEMQAGKFHLAIAVDEYGGTAGLVTLEDLLEELVGDIRDEFDVEEPQLQQLGEGDVRVHGRLGIGELNDLLDAELPDDEWDTVGGLIFNLLGHVPYVGETVEVDGHRLRVERMIGRRITQVRVTRTAPGDDDESEREGAR
jgi:putative hemolysin